MPRTSRSVAQRLATQTKSKRRRPARPTAPEPEATSPASSAPPATFSTAAQTSIAQTLDEVVPAGEGSRVAATPVLAPVAARRGVAGRTARPAVVRRRYSEYAEEYQYIWADLRRIVVVAGVLMVLLVVLSFFIE